MPLAQNIYDNLLEDPDLEVREDQTREEAAASEAEYRARQYYNNVQALSLANEPLNNSALKQLFNFLKTPIKKISKPIEKIKEVITKELLTSGENLVQAVKGSIENDHQHFKNLANKFGDNGKAFFNALITAGAEPTLLDRYMSGMLATGEDNIEEDEWPTEEIHQLQNDPEYRGLHGISNEDLNSFNEQLQRHGPFRDFVPKEALRIEETGEIGDIIHELRQGKIKDKSAIRRKIKDNMRNLTNYPKGVQDSGFEEWHSKVVSGLKAMHFFNEALRSKDGTVAGDPDHFSYATLKRDFTDSFGVSFTDDTEDIFYGVLRDLAIPDEDGKVAESWLAEMKEDREFPLSGADRETGFFLNPYSHRQNLEKHLVNLKYALDEFENNFFEGDEEFIDKFPNGRDWRRGLQDELDGWKDNPKNRMNTPAPTSYDAQYLGPYHKHLYSELSRGIEFHQGFADTLNKLGRAGWSASRLNDLMLKHPASTFTSYNLSDYGLLGRSIELPKNAVKHTIEKSDRGDIVFMAPTKNQLDEELSRVNEQIRTAYQNKRANLDAGASESQLREDEAKLNKAKNALSNIVNKMQIHNDQVKNNPEQLLLQYQMSRDAWETAASEGIGQETAPYDYNDVAIASPDIYSHDDLVDRVYTDLGDTTEANQVFDHLADNKIDAKSLDDSIEPKEFQNIRNTIKSTAQFLGDKTGWGPEGISSELEQRLLSDVFDAMKKGVDIGMSTEEITDQILDNLQQNMPEEEARGYFNDKILPEFELAGGDASAFKPVADTFEEQARQDTPSLETPEPPSDATEASVGDVPEPDLIPIEPTEEPELPTEPTEEPELPIEPTEEPEMPEKTEEPKLDEGKLNEVMEKLGFEQGDPDAQKLTEHYKNNPKKLNSDYEKHIIGDIISNKIEATKQKETETKNQEAETKKVEEQVLKDKQDKANSLPHEKGHLDEYKNEDEEVSSIQATQHARELVAHYLEHKDDMSDEVKKQHEEALTEAFIHGADHDRIAKEMKDYGEDFGSPEFYEEVHEEDIRLAQNHESRNEMVENPNHDDLRDAIENPNKLKPAYEGQLRSAAIDAYNDSVQEIKDLGLDKEGGQAADNPEARAAVTAHREAIKGLEGIVPKEKLKDLTSHHSGTDVFGETEEEKELRELEARMNAEGRVINPKTGRWVKKENLDALVGGFDNHDFGVVNGKHAGEDGSHLITDNDGNGVDEHYQIGKDGQVHFIDESSLSNAPSKTGGDNIMTGQELHGKVLGQKHKSVIGEMKENNASIHINQGGFRNDTSPHGDASRKLEAENPPTPTRTQGTFSFLDRFMNKELNSLESLIDFVKDKDTHERFKQRKRAKELLERVGREKSVEKGII